MSRSLLSPRRRYAASFVLAGALTLGTVSCASDSEGGLASDAKIPDNASKDTALSVSILTSRLQLEASGQIDKLPFTVKDWPELSAGPDVIQGFRGDAIDLASNAAIPPIQAHSTGLDAKIVAVQEKNLPQYKLATAPGSAINGLSDLRGKKIAISPGQAQGVVILRTLRDLGLSKDDVKLIELPSTQFLTALQSKQVDVAPLAEPSLTKYLAKFGSDGAKALQTKAVDAVTVLWAPTKVLADPAKAAAIKSFIPFWANGQVWAWEHKDEWIQKYYVGNQQVTADDGKRILESVPQRPYFPANWDHAIAWTQDTVKLLAGSGYFGDFDANELFDKRFQNVAADAVTDTYRTEPTQ